MTHKCDNLRTPYFVSSESIFSLSRLDSVAHPLPLPLGSALHNFCRSVILGRGCGRHDCLTLFSGFTSDFTNRRQEDIVTYRLLYFLPDTSLCLFVDELQKKQNQTCPK